MSGGEKIVKSKTKKYMFAKRKNNKNNVKINFA